MIRMRLIDADCLMDHAGRDRLDSRELIMQMIENAPTVEMASVMCDSKIPQNCMECECHEFAKLEPGKTVKVICNGGWKRKMKPFRVSTHQKSTPKWCPKKKVSNE